MIYIGQAEAREVEQMLQRIRFLCKGMGRKLPEIMLVKLRADDEGTKQQIEFVLVGKDEDLAYETTDDVEIGGVPGTKWKINLNLKRIEEQQHGSRTDVAAGDGSAEGRHRDEHASN